ncbi:diacylglycerol/lipid kinase family protein [Dellaglioa carnosa]|uniref:Diacylglycerol kinase family lipid kinase n=1 Tax=Dellaglioa carnosa TaxID=2995136 RepID=A0ABT4JK87_9LACO|nr:diacylglycerol kinase family protein [Dellaglioa carnosa]MCZ2490780.1 diacylglycerol kinase family lipid kinase [Dellaglioa carnosa]MCZ2493858.1 diacylglycerol kinase family lipid kinase [Dellaglioa carnosa]MDK1730722.1 diacylglycerol kinase family lipid kinase [Dellaglioa carnosa]
MDHYYIVVNESAGSGHAKQIWQSIKKSLITKEVHFDAHLTKYMGHASLLTENYARHFQPSKTADNQIILVIGGDGTLNECINGIKNAGKFDIPVAYIPAGSGNDFARGAGIPKEPLVALEQILNTTSPKLLNLGVMQELSRNEKKYFINNVGVGFDAQIVSIANQSRSKKLLNKLHLGSLTYLSALLGTLSKQAAFPVTVQVNGQREFYQDAFLLTTSNHPYFGGGVPILPMADPAKNNLDLIIIEKSNILKLLYLAILILSGKHITQKGVHHFTSNKIKLSVDSLEYGQMDGEDLGTRFFEIEYSVLSYPFWLN